ncbi:MAG: hypothetical protein PPP58_10480 [Natronomonas sp.]
MRETLLAVAEVTAYGLVTLVLSALGVFAEWTSLSHLTGGEYIFGVWLAVMGALALYAAFSIATDRLLPRIRALSG